MTAKTKINQLEQRLDKRTKPKDTEFNLTLRIERWLFPLGEPNPNDIITLQEWEGYRQAELSRGKPEAELDKEEATIRERDGFMEIKFYDWEDDLIPPDKIN